VGLPVVNIRFTAQDVLFFHVASLFEIERLQDAVGGEEWIRAGCDLERSSQFGLRGGGGQGGHRQAGDREDDFKAGGHFGVILQEGRIGVALSRRRYVANWSGGGARSCGARCEILTLRARSLLI